MNLQPLIDNLPLLFVAFGFVLWAAARFVEAKAKANPAHDKYDDIAPWLTWASDRYSEAIDWLCQVGALNFKGKEKLILLNKLTQDFQKNIMAGNYVDAVSDVVGYWRDARNKVVASFPLPESITSSDPTSAPANSQLFVTSIGPDDRAGE